MQEYLRRNQNRYIFFNVAAHSITQPHKKETKTMRKTLRVSLLIVLLACSVHASDIIQNGVVSAPPPPSEVTETQEPQTSVAPITEIVLTLLTSVLSIL